MMCVAARGEAPSAVSYRSSDYALGADDLCRRVLGFEVFELQADDRRTILFVFGMARSGTSALTRVLSLCGATLPQGMLGADNTNQRGYWEPREAVYLNRTILHRHGSAWWKSAIPEVATFNADECRDARAAIRKYLDKLPSAPLVVIKDPHLVFLADLWFDASREAGFNVATVLAIRHPNEVVYSLNAVAKVTPEHAGALWLKATLMAERSTRGVPRVFVDYANLLDDWRREIKRISVELGFELDCNDERVVDEFLTPDLRHHHQRGPVADHFGSNWISSVYAAAYSAAQDEPVDIHALDRVFEAYRAGERDFRMVFEADRRCSGRAITRVLTPTVLRWIMNIRAISHRRKGTWA